MKMKIVKIIDEYQVIVNAGKNQDVTKGTCFKVLSDPIEIIDDSTNISLGSIQLDKAVIKAVRVYDDMCICENAVNQKAGVKYRTNSLASQLNLTSVMGGERVDEVHEKLNIDVNDLSNSIAYTETPIRIGDLVEIV